MRSDFHGTHCECGGYHECKNSNLTKPSLSLTKQAAKEVTHVMDMLTLYQIKLAGNGFSLRLNKEARLMLNNLRSIIE